MRRGGWGTPGGKPKLPLRQNPLLREPPKGLREDKHKSGGQAGRTSREDKQGGQARRTSREDKLGGQAGRTSRDGPGRAADKCSTIALSRTPSAFAVGGHFAPVSCYCRTLVRGPARSVSLCPPGLSSLLVLPACPSGWSSWFVLPACPPGLSS